MTDIFDSGKDVTISGISGNVYVGKIYSKGDDTLIFPLHAFVCLSNSEWINGCWHHSISKKYTSDNTKQEFKRFNQDEQTTHLILIPKKPAEFGYIDILSDIGDSIK